MPGIGISVYPDDKYFSYKIDELLFCNDTIELCIIGIKLNSQTLIIVGIYRPHYK